MADKTNNLPIYLDDLHDTICTKKGYPITQQINAQNFASEIASIQVGTIDNDSLYLYPNEKIDLDLTKKILIVSPYDLKNLGTIKLTYKNIVNNTTYIYYDNVTQYPPYICYVKSGDIFWVSSEVGEWMALPNIVAVSLELENVTDEMSFNALFDVYSVK